jgi:hypothetical protein
VAPAETVPKALTTFGPDRALGSWLKLATTRVVLPGSDSTTCTPWASLGPLVVTA